MGTKVKSDVALLGTHRMEGWRRAIRHPTAERRRVAPLANPPYRATTHRRRSTGLPIRAGDLAQQQEQAAQQ
jgi:hypothetical protein